MIELAVILFAATFILLIATVWKLETIMSAVSDLTAAVANLSATVDAAVAKLGTPAGDDPAVVAAAAEVAALDARLAAALNPPAQ